MMNNSPLVLIPSHINPDRNFKPCFFNKHFILALHLLFDLPGCPFCSDLYILVFLISPMRVTSDPLTFDCQKFLSFELTLLICQVYEFVQPPVYFSPFGLNTVLGCLFPNYLLTSGRLAKFHTRTKYGYRR
jgi:hypothetical protein